ncbi:unannotated protein [freshwater metagenome]|uniref:Unannotated protein n=2 Tax=freshwater metagenome TaxID=449393 RepID=A0A6J7HMG6_9ZZZZ|nr:DUF559 domain-containing protein [Actinomycetota bacterium]MSW91959.1 DUF559 domain-containing protein [Actinomycetota bacterium]MSY72199.1 DUF559 domain-containing protein [Actinomycetota bacterium]
MHFRQLQQLSTTQHGLLRRAQLADLGLTRYQIRHYVDRGAIEHVAPTVFRMCGTPNTLAQRRLLAVLDAGPSAVLSHLTAARVWGLQRRSEGRPHVMRVRDNAHRHEPFVGTLHTTRRLPFDHVVRVEGVPVTTPARTIVDLANTHPLGQVARMLDNAWGRRLLHLGELAETLRDVRSRGRRGMRMLDLLIDERRGMTPTESGLERRFAHILTKAGERPFRRQVNFSDHEGWICRADFADDSSPTVAFMDGDTYHRALLDRRHDDMQTRRLTATGLTVLRFSDLTILYEPATVLARVRRARERSA